MKRCRIHIKCPDQISCVAGGGGEGTREGQEQLRSQQEEVNCGVSTSLGINSDTVLVPVDCCLVSHEKIKNKAILLPFIDAITQPILKVAEEEECFSINVS